MKKPEITIFLLMTLTRLLYSQNIESGYVTLLKDSVYYEYCGSGQAMILIHDGIIHCEIWDDQFEFFSENHRVIRYDRRGYGRSSPATDPISTVGELKSLFDHLGVEHAVLVGMSGGGRVAIDFTLEHPEMTTTLILVGSAVDGFSYTQHLYERGGHLPPGLTDIDEIVMYYVSEDPYEIYEGNVEARKRAIELVKAAEFTGASPHFAPKHPALWRLEEITVPTLILVGEFDHPDVHALSGAINAGIFNSVRRLIYDAAHLVPLEQPEVFNDIVREFLRDL